MSSVADLPAPPLHLVLSGENATRIWGMKNATRVERLAQKAGVRTDAPAAADAPILWVDVAYAFDPLWFSHVKATPGLVVTDAGRPVLAHRGHCDRATLDAAMVPDNAVILRLEDRPTLYNHALRKHMQPFCAPLTLQSVRGMERESYYGAYKGVTDILTKYLWPEIAYHLTRGAAKIGMTPNMVSAIGVALCIAATFLFANGHYWTGMLAGFIFMVLDTVDGKLARCTITSSAIGNVIDHGVDLIHPPFWWYAWAMGLSAWGLAYDPTTFWWVQGIIWGGYIVQRLMEGWFIQRFGIHMHVWRKVDSDFRLITARRNPNMILLFFATLAGRPDIGLILVAGWTLISLIVHGVQIVQAEWAKSRGRAIESWLEQGA